MRASSGAIHSISGWQSYRGREGVRQRFEEWLESFDDYRWEVRRMTDCGGGEVLVEATEVGRGAKSGAEVRTTEYELLTIRHGMIVRIREFYDLEDVIECGGEQVVALTRQRGHGSTSGADVELEYAQLIKFRDGRAVEVDMYLDAAEALEAAGLRE